MPGCEKRSNEVLTQEGDCASIALIATLHGAVLTACNSETLQQLHFSSAFAKMESFPGHFTMASPVQHFPCSSNTVLTKICFGQWGRTPVMETAVQPLCQSMTVYLRALCLDLTSSSCTSFTLVRSPSATISASINMPMAHSSRLSTKPLIPSLFSCMKWNCANSVTAANKSDAWIWHTECFSSQLPFTDALYREDI